MSSSGKPVILAFVGNYLPGYKAGGILRITVNTVDHLCDEFEFKIVTRDRDVGDDKPYADIWINQWQKVGNAMVYYLPPQSSTVKDILNLIVSTPHHVLYLNSFFDPFTIKVLLNRILHRAHFKPVIVAPWGEFAWASLKQKYPKKFVFIQAARLFGLYKKVTWRASSEFEAQDIIKVMKIKPGAIHITGDFPLKNIPDVASDVTFKPSTDDKGLKIVFLSRISREKNLDYALRVLSKVNAKVFFDIYGPAENATYWKECQELIGQLPANVIVNYNGSVNPNHVVHIFNHYDLFLFPTGGEAYGHVIAECLISGTSVLISTETPWRNLQTDGLGWDVDLAREDSFVEVIERLALLSDDERLKKRAIVKSKIMERLIDPAVLESNRQLFKRQLLR
jgi:glycosyltransferase involved in cell wall biosynthesis